MTPELQPLDISVNKIFKDNIKLRFEEQRICYDKLNPKVKLTTARLNLIDYIYNIWKNDNIISRDIIINGFKHACLINNYYLSNEEERINDLNTYNLINEDKNDIIDDLGQEINICEKELEELNDLELEEKDEKDYDNLSKGLKNNKVFDMLFKHSEGQINEDLNENSNKI